MRNVLIKEVVTPRRGAFLTTLAVLVGVVGLSAAWLAFNFLGFTLAVYSGDLLTIVVWVALIPVFIYFGFFHPGPGRLMDRFIFKRGSRIKFDIDK